MLDIKKQGNLDIHIVWNQNNFYIINDIFNMNYLQNYYKILLDKKLDIHNFLIHKDKLLINNQLHSPN